MLKLAIPYRNAFKNLASNDANFTLNPTSKECRDEILMMKDFLEIFHKGAERFTSIFPFHDQTADNFSSIL
jgi:hypothetical protein